mmetsp:Transcript_43978/g.113863  ORF Transcript_43978/g.113863 Transcript_43978/m.113863 type:complete len:262 (-) Transcript_43978:38-823(-)
MPAAVVIQVSPTTGATREHGPRRRPSFAPAFGAVFPGSFRVFRHPPLGGNHVHRELRMYEVSSRGNTRPCNKYGTQSSSNLPGIMVHWCLHCKNCVMFGVMDSAEGPGSAFEHFHCFYPKMPDAISYDNGCNLHRYALNREPWLWKFVQILIDEFHAKNHIDCSCNYNSAEHKTKAGNFSLCEQKFAPLAASANAFSHMDQVSFLLLMRFKLACMNLYQWERTRGTGRVFWRAPPRHVARAAGRTDRLDLHGAHCEPLINV